MGKKYSEGGGYNYEDRLMPSRRSQNQRGCVSHHYNSDGTLHWGYFQINTVHLKRAGVNLRDPLVVRSFVRARLASAPACPPATEPRRGLPLEWVLKRKGCRGFSMRP